MASGQLPGHSNGRAPALLQRQRSTLYWLRYCEKSILRMSLSMARFPRDRYLPVGVTSRQQVERLTARAAGAPLVRARFVCLNRFIGPVRSSRRDVISEFRTVELGC
jgi:hypothetical protein